MLRRHDKDLEGESPGFGIVGSKVLTVLKSYYILTRFVLPTMLPTLTSNQNGWP